MNILIFYLTTHVPWELKIANIFIACNKVNREVLLIMVNLLHLKCVLSAFQSREKSMNHVEAKSL